MTAELGVADDEVPCSTRWWGDPQSDEKERESTFLCFLSFSPSLSLFPSILPSWPLTPPPFHLSSFIKEIFVNVIYLSLKCNTYTETCTDPKCTS